MTTKTARIQIILARVEMSGLRSTGKMVMRDLNWFPEMVVCAEAKTCPWKWDGTEQDIPAAQSFAATEGYTVFTYPKAERNARAKAADSILAAFNRGDVKAA